MPLYDKLEEVQQHQKKRYFCALLLCISILTAIAALFVAIDFGILSYVETQKLPQFTSSTDFESDDLAIVSSVTNVFFSTNAIPCTNKTLGNETRIFSGKTFLGIPCPKSDNTCSEFFCGGDGYCNQRAISGGECYDDFGCDEGFSCNSTTCLCDEDPIIQECTVDSDCTEFNANPCIESKCVSNTCQINLTPGAECSSPTQCSGGGFTCNSTCMCTPVMVSTGCTVDGDCQAFNANPCVEAVCVNSTCETNLIAGAECLSETQCTSGQSCNATCMCEDTISSTSCLLDSDCQAFNANPCIESVCNSGFCEINLIAGATCSSTTQCGTGQSCNATCLCEDAAAGASTFSDADFAVYNNADNTKIITFDASNLNTSSTYVYSFPANSAEPGLSYDLSYTKYENGTTANSGSTWSSGFPVTWRISQNSHLVILSLEENIHAFFANSPITYTTLVPAAYIPPIFLTAFNGAVPFAVLVYVNSLTVLGFCSVGTDGTITISPNSGGFTSGMTGHGTISVSWIMYNN